MKTLAIIALLFAASLSVAQKHVRVNDGQVARAIPLPAGGGFSLDFALIQAIGGGSDGTGVFAYDKPKIDGPFHLSYTGHVGCPVSCSFTATFVHWFKPVVRAYCTSYAGAVIGTFTLNGKDFTNSEAFYSQEFCANGGVYRFAGGDLSVFLKGATKSDFSQVPNL